MVGARVWRCSGQERDHGGGVVGLLRRQRAVLNGRLRYVAGGEDGAVTADQATVLVDRKKPVNRTERQSAAPSRGCAEGETAPSLGQHAPWQPPRYAAGYLPRGRAEQWRPLQP